MKTMETKELNEWFAGTSFDEMERMFGLRYTDFDEGGDGYQSFVDECEKRWNALSTEDKERLYNNC